MNATVNSNCIGCGLCVSICPEVFEIGDDGLAQPIQEVTETLEKTASQARESCPVNAIDLEGALPPPFPPAAVLPPSGGLCCMLALLYLS